MNRRIGFILTISFWILIFGSCISFSQNSDSIKQLISTTTDNSKLIELYQNLTKSYLNRNDSNSVKTAQKLIDLTKISGTDSDLASAYDVMGLALKTKGNVFLSVEYLLKEKELREKFADDLGLANCLKNLGESYRSFSEHVSAFENLYKALTIFKQLHYQKGIAETLNRIGAVYAEIQINDSILNAISYATESNVIAEKIRDIDLQVSNHLIIGASHIFLNNFKPGLENLFISLGLIDSANERFHRSLILKDIATAYYGLKDYPKAIQYGMQSYKYSLDDDILVYKWLSTHILFMTYQDINQIDSAYKYLNLFINYKGTLYDQDKERAIHLVEGKYQKEKYDSELKNEEKVNKMMNLIYIISFLPLLIILIAFIFRYNKLKKINLTLSQQNTIIENQKEELTILNATKDKFFSIIAHDLRNPIGSFKNTTTLLSNTHTTISEKERVEFIDLMMESSKSLYSLLENLLEWSRSQRGTIPFVPVEFQIKRISNDALDTLTSVAAQKNIKIENKINESTVITADPNMVKTIIRNLISNAIKFTPENGVITLDSILDGDNFRFSVKDTGIGMTEEMIAKLFRIDQSTTTLGTANEKGTGLGLILCKEFVEKHGGRIWVESQPQQGSTFYFTVPK